MENTKIIIERTELIKNPNTKTTYLFNEYEKKAISEKEYENITSEDAIQFFKRLGGTERKTYSYTCDGYKITKLVSYSPNKKTKVVRTFKFIYSAN